MYMQSSSSILAANEPHTCTNYVYYTMLDCELHTCTNYVYYTMLHCELHTCTNYVIVMKKTITYLQTYLEI